MDLEGDLPRILLCTCCGVKGPYRAVLNVTEGCNVAPFRM